MKKIVLGLFVSLLTIALSGNAVAKPSFGSNCAMCHGAPVVDTFDLPASHDSLTVPITAFTASDTDPQKSSLAGVSGYLLTTSTAAPSAGDPGWQSAPPSDYTFATDGMQTLYAWVKDSLGIVSAAVSDAVDILIFTNTPPVADAGPDQTVAEGVLVTLNGSNSDDSDDGIAGFQWEQVGGTVNVALANADSEQPTFETPNVGPGGVSLTFRLTVTDNSGASATDTMIVNVTWVNVQPVADAGLDQTVSEGATVFLDGSASSDIDDGIVAYTWRQVDTSGISVSLSDATASNPQFTVTNVGPDGAALTFELTVTDAGGLQATDSCVVNVTNLNMVPVANAGVDQTVESGSEVTLDASASYDPDNDMNPDTAFTWKQTAGAAVTLSSPGAINPVFTAPTVPEGGSETLIFELTVTDNGLLQATDGCEVVVNGPTPPPVEPPPVEDPPVVEPPVEPPPVEEPPVVEPPVSEPPVTEPPVVEPPVEEPPVVEPPAPTPEPPSTELLKEYRRLAKKYLKLSKKLKKKSKRYYRLYRKNRHKNPTAADAYLEKALDYKAKSLDARYEARTYQKLYREAKQQLENYRQQQERESDDDDDEDEDEEEHERDHDRDDDDDDDDEDRD